MYVCMYVHMYVYMSICMHVYISIYIAIDIQYTHTHIYICSYCLLNNFSKTYSLSESLSHQLSSLLLQYLSTVKRLESLTDPNKLCTYSTYTDLQKVISVRILFVQSDHSAVLMMRRSDRTVFCWFVG